MEWIGSIENKRQAIRDLHARLGSEGDPGLLVRFDTSNKEMRDAEAVADALETVASLLREGFTSGPIADANGNTVGDWTAEIPGPIMECEVCHFQSDATYEGQDCPKCHDGTMGID